MLSYALQKFISCVFLAAAVVSTLAHSANVKGAETDPLIFQGRTRSVVGDQIDVSERQLKWDPKKTAVIICDMWDQHWCKGAASRVAEMAPRVNEVIVKLRSQGVLIIHCPSDTMKFY